MVLSCRQERISQHRPGSLSITPLRFAKQALTEAVDTETPTGRLMFNFLGTIAEYFLDLNKERTVEEFCQIDANQSLFGQVRQVSGGAELPPLVKSGGPCCLVDAAA